MILDRLLARSKWQETPRSAEIGDCLVWTGHTDRRGYGVMKCERKLRFTHRLAWIERHGPISIEKPYVCHHCDNPPCWRDDHLFLGAQAGNMADCAAKGRANNGNARKERCLRGHALDSVNLYVTPTGKRQCRICNRAAWHRYNERRHAKVVTG